MELSQFAFREMIPRRAESREQLTTAAAGRIVSLDRARSFITLMVVLHHSVINYTYFGHGDRMRWLGFDLVVLFNDSFFMACMFLISGLFVSGSLARRGSANFLAVRAWRLGVPFLVSIFVIMPIAYYASFMRYHLSGTADFDFFHFWWHTITLGPWPSGSAWFLWALLVLGTVAAGIWSLAPRMFEILGRQIFALRERPFAAFAAFLVVSIVIYLPMRLIFGDSAWFDPGGYPIPIQTSRIFLYAGYFFIGIGAGALSLRTGILAEDGALTRHWSVWLAFAAAFYGGILLLVYAHHNWLTDFNSPPLWWQTAYGVLFAMFSAAMAFTVFAVFLRSARSALWPLDAMHPSAYGIYLLHFIPLIWLQYVVYEPPLSPFIKFAIVFAGTLSTSWIATALLRKIPLVARMI
jgi:surface polysaccharide O-acyltransferase-like enzyme